MPQRTPGSHETYLHPAPCPPACCQPASGATAPSWRCPPSNRRWWDARPRPDRDCPPPVRARQASSVHALSWRSAARALRLAQTMRAFAKWYAPVQAATALENARQQVAACWLHPPPRQQDRACNSRLGSDLAKCRRCAERGSGKRQSQDPDLDIAGLAWGEPACCAPPVYDSSHRQRAPPDRGGPA